MVNFNSSVIRWINIILLSLFFIMMASSLIRNLLYASDSFNEFNTFPLSDLKIVTYPFYLIFCVALIQYIRKISLNWHNYFLAFVWIYIGWIIFNSTLILPHLFESFTENKISVIQQVGFHLLFFISGIIFLFPFAIFLGFQAIDKFVKRENRKFYNILLIISMFALCLLALYYTFFGDSISYSLEAYRTNQPISSNFENLSYSQKISNLKYARKEIFDFLGKLYFNPIIIFLEIALIFALVVSVTNKKLNN